MVCYLEKSEPIHAPGFHRRLCVKTTWKIQVMEKSLWNHREREAHRPNGTPEPRLPSISAEAPVT